MTGTQTDWAVFLKGLFVCCSGVVASCDMGNGNFVFVWTMDTQMKKIVSAEQKGERGKECSAARYWPMDGRIDRWVARLRRVSGKEEKQAVVVEYGLTKRRKEKKR